MKLLRITFIILTLLSGTGMGAIRLGFIQNSSLTSLIFVTFILSLLGDAGLALYSLRTQPWKDASGKSKNASEVIRQALDLACLAITTDGLHNIRANVFTKCERKVNKICIKYCSTNMVGASDLELQLERWQGCAGQAWGYKAPIVADLTLPEVQGGSKWGLTSKQKEMTSQLMAILSLPIRHPDDNELIIGILSFDSPDPVADLLTEDYAKDVALGVATQLGLLLSGFGDINPL